MRNLFLVDGAAGTGKSDMLAYVSRQYSTRTATYLTKLTTRKQRDDEKKSGTKLDLEFVSKSEFDRRVESKKYYKYRYGDEWYAISRNRLDELLREFRCVFVIVRNHDLMNTIKRDYGQVARATSVYVHSDAGLIRERLARDGYSEAAIDFRLRRQELVWEDYRRHSGSYDEVLINNSNRIDLHRLVESLVQKHGASPLDRIAVAPDTEFLLPNALVGYQAGILSRLQSSSYERNVFLMMKFRDGNAPVHDFIREQLEGRGFNCVRADDPSWNITNNVHNPVAVLHCCKYGIALFDEGEDGNDFSPNVAYELGMMHLQRKMCLILRHSSLPSMPFDLIKDLHHTYKRDLELRGIVTRWLTEVSEPPRE